jgi:hypothetical protein
MRRSLAAAIMIGVLVATGCVKKEESAGTMTNSNLPQLTDVDSASWARLAERRIFFGHQSVGRNIVDGINDVLAANPQIRLRVVESKDLDTMRAAGFYHASVGRNQFPEEKEVEFAAIADSAFSATPGIGMVKFCYVDVRTDTDPQALFEAYQRRMAELAARRPGLTLVHLTMPLTTWSITWKGRVKKLLGRTTAPDLNPVRNRFNALMREVYSGRAPLFDLATLESTRLDGSRAYYTQGSDTVYTLTPEYTNDGGHLNEASRRMIAEQLLIFLARLPAS